MPIQHSPRVSVRMSLLKKSVDKSFCPVSFYLEQAKTPAFIFDSGSTWLS